MSTLPRQGWFLNQVCASLSHTWFLNIDPVQIVSMCVCVCLCVCVSAPRLLITSGVMWCDMDPIRLVKQVLQLLFTNRSRYR